MPKKILIVDDMELNRMILVRFLSKRGFDVLNAEDGSSALQMAENSSPDLILLDIGLPDIDGWQVTKTLKASNKTNHIPIIIITAHALQEIEDKVSELGCSGYVAKPYELPDVLAAINNSLESELT